ncbi:hypothetical protein CONCODRAFT_79945 [Conidiobolus coronatus NRRL 28638]|uniref:Cyclin-Q n=1 Tax=Conidiobolus coronatus (strain ATCC 28846 / CBS 209.66 / NRRL 28638) TaxID=796925 RepID=A0A137NYY3_CONC2|nr:hypothetical protein CONCODRAFT_79945 [Conidiobolus coronatus NRRL 28638]|eukprot:KXN67996.1 hypothetical protein CONCODRAFT_79945 [Conidiobolus coronatus NRRL 28638]
MTKKDYISIFSPDLDSIQISPLTFLYQCNKILALPFSACANIQVLYLKFKYNKDEFISKYLDDYLAIAAIIYLTCRINNLNRKTRDIVNVCYHILHPYSEHLKLGDAFYKMRDSLFEAELIVLRVLNFDIQAEYPHQYIEEWATKVLPLGEDNQTELDYHRDIIQSAWFFANQCINCPEIILEYKSFTISRVCIYLALRCCNSSSQELLNVIIILNILFFY